MVSITLKDNPVIFPKLTFLICKKGASIQITGKKRADFKLSEYMVEASLGRDIPEIAVLNLEDGNWFEYWTSASIIPSVGNEYTFHSVKEEDIWNLSLLTNFVQMHSSATFKYKEF